MWYFVSNVLKKNLWTFFSFKPHIFLMFNLFWMIWKPMGGLIRIHKTSLYSKCNKTMMKECNLKIWKYDILFQMFWRKMFEPFLVSNFIFFSFFIHFEWSKNLKVCQLRIYKTRLNSKCNKTMMKKYNLKIWNCFNVSIIKHELPLHKTTHIFLIPWLNWTFFVELEVVDGRLQMFF